jgi:hypothetical protein
MSLLVAYIYWVYYVPGTSKHVTCNTALTITQRDLYFYYPHFRDKEAEMLRGWIPWPK